MFGVGTSTLSQPPCALLVAVLTLATLRPPSTAAGFTEKLHPLNLHESRKKDRAGNPVDCVRIVFPEEWMARRERRPLLDAGARVFFMDRKTGNDIEIKD
jgi:hypothetical protein